MESDEHIKLTNKKNEKINLRIKIRNKRNITLINRTMFYIDKYAPKTPEQSVLHKDVLKLLKHMSNDDSIPHIIFYGRCGVGKRRIIKLFLEMLYGQNVNNTGKISYKVVGSGNKEKEVIVVQSEHHIVIDPVDNNFDKYLVQDIVKEYAKRMHINLYASKKPFKTVLINSIDNMSYYAQTSLRRTMEKYSSTCRLIMWCESLSRVIDPLKSRCICIKIKAPPYDDMFRLSLRVAATEKIDMNMGIYDKIIADSNGSVKKLLWKLQFLKEKQNNKYETSYDETIDGIVSHTMKYSTTEIRTIRTLLYNLLITNVEPLYILRDIVLKICNNKKLPNEYKIKIISSCAYYEHCMTRRRREIVHLEAFIVATMDIINSYVVTLNKAGK